MKIAFVLITFVLSTQSYANQFIDLFPLQLHYRYEDSADQAIEVIQYRTLGVAIQPGFYRLGFEYSRQEYETGNSSLSVRTDLKEYTLSASCRLLQVAALEKRRSLDFFVGAVLGTTQTEVRTQLFNNPSTSKSGSNLVYGLSASLIGRIHYFAIETEFKILTSKNFSPQVVPVAQIKLGASIPY